MSLEQSIRASVGEIIDELIAEKISGGLDVRVSQEVPLDTVYTLAEAAKRLNISHNTLRKLKDGKHIRYHMTARGGHVRFTEADCREYLKWTRMHWDAFHKGQDYPQLPAQPLSLGVAA